MKVPGTSANLGPGFDILGLALNIYNDFYFEFNDSSNFQYTYMDGSPLPFQEDENLVHYAYKYYFDRFLPKISLIPYNVKMNLDIPFKGGLGSSATALVSGFCAAKFVHTKILKLKNAPNINQLLYYMSEIEGHPDNTTPAFLGGFVLAYKTSEENLHYFKKKFPSNISLFVFSPDIQIGTNDSRKKLPEIYPVNDVIFNMSRVSTWVEFLYTKKFDHLKLALKDKVHTPYRIRDNMILIEAIKIIESLDGDYSLSGSGPTLLIYYPKKNVNGFYSKLYKRLKTAMNRLETNFVLRKVKAANKGVQIQ